MDTVHGCPDDVVEYVLSSWSHIRIDDHTEDTAVSCLKWVFIQKHGERLIRIYSTAISCQYLPDFQLIKSACKNSYGAWQSQYFVSIYKNVKISRLNSYRQLYSHSHYEPHLINSSFLLMQSYLLNQVLLSYMDFHMACLEWALRLTWVEIAVVWFPFLSSSLRHQSEKVSWYVSELFQSIFFTSIILTSFLISKSFGLSVPLRSSRSEVDEVPLPCVVLGLWFSYRL